VKQQKQRENFGASKTSNLLSAEASRDRGCKRDEKTKRDEKAKSDEATKREETTITTRSVLYRRTAIIVVARW